MAQIATTIEQSKKLIELGIDVNTADMHWHYYIIDNTYELSAHKIEDIQVYDNPNEIPAWSLTALLELIPHYTLRSPNPLLEKYCCICVEYEIETYGDTQLDAAFEMVVWLKENEEI